MKPVDQTDLDWERTGDEDEGGVVRRKRLGAAAGGEALGCSLHELPPGEGSWPYHWHAANEEAIYVLAGRGVVRLPDGEARLSPGDYLARPAGPEGAHRVVNDGDEPLRYLVLSTMREPDVLGYPDADTVGVYAGSPPGGDESERDVDAYFREADAGGFPTDAGRGGDGAGSDGESGDGDRDAGENEGEG